MNTTYPNSPGFKGTAETGRNSAKRVAGKAALQRKQILATLVRPATHDEVAAMLRPKEMTDVEFETFKRGIRSRCSELKEQGKIQATAERRVNSSGHPAVVWRLDWAFQIQTAKEPRVSVVTTASTPATASSKAVQQELI